MPVAGQSRKHTMVKPSKTNAAAPEPLANPSLAVRAPAASVEGPARAASAARPPRKGTTLQLPFAETQAPILVEAKPARRRGRASPASPEVAPTAGGAPAGGSGPIAAMQPVGSPKGRGRAAKPEPVPVRGRRRQPVEGLGKLYRDLMSKGAIEETFVTLRPTMIGTHPAHPDQIVTADQPSIATLAYVIEVGGENLGHLLVHAPNRFALVAPRIQGQRSVHLNLSSAAMRADIAAEGYLARKAAGDRRTA